MYRIEDMYLYENNNKPSDFLVYNNLCIKNENDYVLSLSLKD